MLCYQWKLFMAFSFALSPQYWHWQAVAEWGRQHGGIEAWSGSIAREIKISWSCHIARFIWKDARGTRVFLCFSISAKYWKFFILIALRCRRFRSGRRCRLSAPLAWAECVCVSPCQLPCFVIHTWMIRGYTYIHTYIYRRRNNKHTHYTLAY